jgi:sec-independent protein translocase protein TatB
MFDFSWGELVIIGAVALIVIGPKELPAVLRTMGQWMTKVRRMASEFQGQFQEAMREAEMADLKREIDTATRGFGSHFDDPFDEANKPKPDSGAASAPDSAASASDSTVSATMPAEAPPTSEVVTPDGYSVSAAPAAPPVTEASLPAVPTAPTAEPAPASTSTPVAARPAPFGSASMPAVSQPAPHAASAPEVAKPTAPVLAHSSAAAPAEHAAPPAPPASPAPLVTEGSDRA